MIAPILTYRLFGKLQACQAGSVDLALCPPERCRVLTVQPCSLQIDGSIEVQHAKHESGNI